MKIVVIDGQGGRMGSMLIDKIRKEKIEIDELTQNLQSTYKKGMELFKSIKKNR